MIDAQLAAFLQEGVGIHIATRNGALQPNGARAIAVQAVPSNWWERAEAWVIARPVAAQGIAVGALLVAADAAVGQAGVAPFIYYQF